MSARRRPAPDAVETPTPPVDTVSTPESPARASRRPRRPGSRPRLPRRDAATAPAPAPSAQNQRHDQDQASATAATVAGVVGDASAAATRGGEDTRRRGWFWHWNSIVTQYAPLIGLKGVGLLNSYTVWTDRREESPHRGYAFPSQQREADFYGEDRAELITINKILVALDLIEIRKEMVLRTDERGRRWRVPHNFYRVKDQGDGFTLSTDAVRAVVALADRDRAVYRYLRRIFSPRFAPIDPENVWGAILAELRDDEVWARLAAKTVRDEDRASARSRAGHASRRAAVDPSFLLPSEGDTATPEPTAGDTTNDSPTVETTTGGETSVALCNTGLASDVDGANTGSAAVGPSIVALASSGGATSVAPSNRTYHQENTTTTTGSNRHEPAPIQPSGGPGSGSPPDDRRDEATALLRFEEANARGATPAERRLLRELARTFTPAAAAHGATGWGWLGAAVDDAVAAGSVFVAPRRLREILLRWEREGPPAEVAESAALLSDRSQHPLGREARPASTRSAPPVRDTAVSRPGAPPTGRQATGRVGGVGSGDAEPPPPVAGFTVEECGLSSRQVWSAILDELRAGGDRASVDTWLRDAMIVGRGESGALVVGLPHELARRRVADRFVTPLRRAVTAVVGVALPVEVVLARDWFASQGTQVTGKNGVGQAKRSG